MTVVSKYPKFILFAVVLFVINLLVMNSEVAYWDEDEAAYAGFAIEMLQTGDWVNPNFEHATIHRKTPLHFWTIAACYKLLGTNEFATRLPSSIAILLTCFLVFRLGRNLWGEKIACRAALILMSSIAIPIMGKIAFTDATLLCFSTLSVFSLLNYMEQPNWRWNLGFWLGIAFGILTKGPPIILLLGGMWLLLAIFHPHRKNLIGIHPWIFGPIALLPFAYWCYLSYLQDYSYWQTNIENIPFEEWWQEEYEEKKVHLLPFLWDWYVLRRIGGNVLGQSGFWGYHLVILTASFLTWMPFWWGSLKDFFKTIRQPEPKQLYLIIWVVMGWFFWELMTSKLPSYSLAAQPALAFIIALHIQKIEKNPASWSGLHRFGLGLYFFVFGIIILGLPIASYLIFGQTALLFVALMSIVLLLLLIRVWNSKADIKKLPQELATFGLVFMFLLWAIISPIIENSPIKAFDNVIAKAKELSDEETTLVFTHIYYKQRKMSLYVYGRQEFEQTTYLGAIEDAPDFYQQEGKKIFLLDQDKLERYRKQFKKAEIPFEPVPVVHWSTDDKLREYRFYLLRNW